jgi:hypothetical protein
MPYRLIEPVQLQHEPEVQPRYRSLESSTGVSPEYYLENLRSFAQRVDTHPIELAEPTPTPRRGRIDRLQRAEEASGRDGHHVLESVESWLRFRHP